MAVIESLAIAFDDALNVITGETGAGKSIIIKALGLVTGGKASADVVRAGCAQAVVTATFQLPMQHRAFALIEELGLKNSGDDGDHFLLLRRQVTSLGKSQGWINDVPVTLHVLKAVGNLVVDIFGQQENLRLLDPGQHIHYLDLFLTDDSTLTATTAAYYRVSTSLKAIEARLATYDSARQSQDYLDFRARELNDFDPSVDDYTRIAAVCQRAGQQQVFHQGLARAQTLVDEGSNDEPLSQRVWEAVRTLERLSGAPSLEPVINHARDVAASLDQLSFELSQAAASFTCDEGDLESAQERLAAYQTLFRKLGVTGIDALLSEQQRIQAEIALVHNIAAQLRTDLTALGLQSKTLAVAALALHAARAKAAQMIRRRVEAELKDLAMPDARFEVEVSALVRPAPALDFKGLDPDLAALFAPSAAVLAATGELGSDRVQFMLSANRGEKPLPLQKTASGGELSRIMLAIKKTLATGAETCVLVFDEIDTGISGKTADIVGYKLKELSRRFQVLCISHLAQVAAYGDAHFRVQKEARDKRTESQIVRLTAAESAQEIARILSGEEITAPSLKNAHSLVDRARKASQGLS